MPLPPSEIDAPAGYVPQVALSFGADGAAATAVDLTSPLPVSSTLRPATSGALAGTATGVLLAGPFAPELGRAIVLTLQGNWTGLVRLLRSTDAGATRNPLTAAGQPWAQFSANCNEAVAEESVAGATYYLDLAVASGSLTYRLEQ